MKNIAVYCARCDGSGTRKNAPEGTPCGLCQGGVIGVVLATDLLPAIQDAITTVGIETGPSRPGQVL